MLHGWIRQLLAAEDGSGVGAGKYLGVRRDLAILASDRSLGLASQAAQRLQPSPSLGPPCSRADVALADALRLPYRHGAFDAALCIAVRPPAGSC